MTVKTKIAQPQAFSRKITAAMTASRARSAGCRRGLAAGRLFTGPSSTRCPGTGPRDVATPPQELPDPGLTTSTVMRATGLAHPVVWYEMYFRVVWFGG